MNVVAVLLLVLCGSLAAEGQTLQQCKTGADDLMLVKTDSDFVSLTKTMTAGDELNLSTQFARCLERYASQLTPEQFNKMDRLVYKLDADVIARMFDFIERHQLTDKFNREQEARRVK